MKFQKALRAVQKPGRYIGGEVNSVVKDKRDVKLRFAFCFPDVYEVAMSHLGTKILYDVLNRRDDVWCERVFAPWFDMIEQMRALDIPLFALESRDAVKEFDVVGFTLQYELSFTNILLMLDLAGIPLKSEQRGSGDPFVVAGGPCACNPEPLADFIDVFMLGEGEQMISELASLFIEAKENGLSRAETLQRAAGIEGVYVPALYAVDYNTDNTIKSVAARKGAPNPVKKRLVDDFETATFPEKYPVPMIEVIHDRTTLEVLRGCARGCRFCQAGFIYRPFRARSAERLNEQAKTLCDNTGYDEISLTSLSTSDHPQLEPLLDELLGWTTEQHINLSLPSLRIDNFSDELVEKTTRVKRSGLTFAPEAGTQRLRDVINKNITEDEIMRGCETAFSAGYTAVKLYFMMGLPSEADEDIVGIAQLAQRIVDLYYSLPTKPKGRSVSVNVSVACFVPKPFTPFEFVAADTLEEFRRKQALLLSSLTSKKISVNYHDAETSLLEAVFARGDRRLGDVLLAAYEKGQIYDSWHEGFNFSRWQAAFDDRGSDMVFYSNRHREKDEVMPWDLFDYGVSKDFLYAEYQKALAGKTTASCLLQCAGCGMKNRLGGKCDADASA